MTDVIEKANKRANERLYFSETTPRVPSAEETLESMNCGGGDRQWQQDIETIRAYGNAVLEAAAEVADQINDETWSRDASLGARTIARRIRKFQEDL